MSTRRRRNRKTARQGLGNAGKSKSNTVASANAEIAGGASFPHDWKRVVLSLASNTVIVMAISYVVLYLAMKAEAVHDGFPTSWVQVSLPDLTRLIPSLVLVFTMLWYFVLFLASCREIKSPSSLGAVVRMLVCSALAMVVPIVTMAFFMSNSELIGGDAPFCVACYAGLFVGFIWLVSCVFGFPKRKASKCWERFPWLSCFEKRSAGASRFR